MLLQALYEYGTTHEACLPEGFVLKNPKAVVHLTADGQFVGVERREKGAAPVVCPSVFTAAYGSDKCDPFIANASIVLALDGPEDNIEKWRTKRTFFLEILEQAKTDNPDAGAVLSALTSIETFQQISDGAKENKVKPSEMISFLVDGRHLSSDARTIEFWQRYRGEISSDKDKPTGICMISGKYGPVAQTMKKTMGLSSVGGMGAGDALTCFDKHSFRSYGLDKFQIAPMGERASDIIVDTLNALLQDAPQIAGTKFVHWYKEQVPADMDPINLPFGLMMKDDNDSEEENSKEAERSAMSQVDALFNRIFSGADAVKLDNVYHILVLSAYSGRVMVRRYEEGTYGDLSQNIHKWYEDTSIVGLNGTGLAKHYKLMAMMIGIMEQPNASKLYEQVGDEFAASLQGIIDAIINGYQIPLSVVRKALIRIQSDLLRTSGKEDSPNSGRQPVLNIRALQWLKAYVSREEQKNKEEYTMPALNPNHPSPAYQCGRLLAIYGEIQQTANGGKPVGVSVVKRYYPVMSTNPSRAIPQLDNLSKHHLSKISSKYISDKFKMMLGEVYDKLGADIPERLNTKERSYFVLGYHQELSEITRAKIEASAEKKSKQDASENTNTEETDK